MTQEELQVFLKEEPQLQSIIDRVKKRDAIAKEQHTYWYEVWMDIKMDLWYLVGDEAKNPNLRTSWHWDKMHDYLSSITPNCK